MQALHVAEETELNMTPMIDIVFQLIIFFLLSLRFKTLDERIDARLPQEGLRAFPALAPSEHLVKVRLFRRGLESAEGAQTVVRIGTGFQAVLPAGWKGLGAEPPVRARAYAEALDAVRGEIVRHIAAFGCLPDEARGQISAPPPSGGAVPHGDAVGVLDAFLAAGVLDVAFEGAAPPLSPRERASRAATR